MNREAGPPRGLQGRRLRRDARRHDDRHGSRDPLEVVGADVDGGARLPELRGPGIERRAGADVGGVRGDAVIAQQQRRGHPALAEPHDRHFPAAGAPLLEERNSLHDQRTLRVESATSAQSRPRM